MKIFYDFHIHSALSPCGDNDMTPEYIVAMANVKGLDAIAISDHNSIKNVKATMKCGEDFGIIVVPAMEVQSSEDIHILTLFYDFQHLEEFYHSLSMNKIKNKVDIFGNQFIINENNQIIGEEENLLLLGIKEDIYTIVQRVKDFEGIAIPAHIDREENGIVSILGDIPEDLRISTVEFSLRAEKDFINKYKNRYKCIFNSDAHYLQDISEKIHILEIQEKTIKGILDSIAG